MNLCTNGKDTGISFRMFFLVCCRFCDVFLPVFCRDPILVRLVARSSSLGSCRDRPPINCALNGWSSWGSCSTSCSGTGTRVRTKSIKTYAASHGRSRFLSCFYRSPKYGGTACPSSTSDARRETQSCSNGCRYVFSTRIAFKCPHCAFQTVFME